MARQQLRHGKGSREGGRFRPDQSGRTPPSNKVEHGALETFPSDEELRERANAIALAYASFRGDDAPRLEQYNSLLDRIDPREPGASGMISITVPAGQSDAISGLINEVKAEIAPSAQRSFQRRFAVAKRSHLDGYILSAEQEPSPLEVETAQSWRALIEAALPSVTVTTVQNADGSTTHTTVFIDAQWSPATEALFAAAGRRECSLTGDICFADNAYSLHCEPTVGACYRLATEEPEGE